MGTKGYAFLQFILSKPLREVFLLPIILSAFLIVISYYNFLLFHTLAELFAIAISVIMLAVAWQTYPYSRNAFLMFLACAYFWIGGVDLVHTLVYKGINIVPGMDANPPTQLWLVARYSQALALLASPLFLSRSLKSLPTFLTFGALIIIAVALVFSGHFPDAFIEGEGLTAFKIRSEYVIILILASALAYMAKERKVIGTEVFGWLAISIVLTMIAELSFTFYVSVYGLSNLVGHLFKLFSFWLIFIAIIRVSLREPYLTLEKRVAERTQSLTEAQRVAHLGSWEWNIVTNELSWSDEIYRIFGLKPQEFGATYETFLDAVHPDDRDAVKEAVTNSLEHNAPYGIDHRVVRPDGEERIVHEEGEVFMDDTGTPVLMIGTLHDVTQSRRADEKLRHMVNHDTLTGLPTRRLGMEHISSALAAARRDKSKAAVLFIDLDGFKEVNDTLGHDAGDQLLVGVGERLLYCVREVDTVARIGGDEFMIVMNSIKNNEDVALVAQKLIDALGQPFMLDNETVSISASVGIALYPDHEQEPKALLKRADQAMYGVKGKGKNNFAFCKDL